MSAILKQKLIDIANGFTKYGLWKSGSSSLSEMNDVTFNNLQANDVLIYNGSEWINDDNLQTQIDTLNSNLQNTYGTIKSIVLGEYTSLYDALRNCQNGITLDGSYNLSNVSDKPSLTGNFYMCVFIKHNTFYYSKVLLINYNGIAIGGFTSADASTLTWKIVQ